jgi:hypothetical protein
VPRPRDSRDITLPIGTPSTRRRLVGEILDPDQQQHRPLLLGQCRKGAKQITVLERPILTPLNPRQLGLRDLDQCIRHATPPLADLIAEESIVKDRVQPAAQISFGPAQVPAGDRALDAVLHAIVGALTIAAQQGAGEPAQTGNVRFDQRGLISHGVTVATIRNRRPVALIGRRGTGRGGHHRRQCAHCVITFLLAIVPFRVTDGGGRACLDPPRHHRRAIATTLLQLTLFRWTKSPAKPLGAFEIFTE